MTRIRLSFYAGSARCRWRLIRMPPQAFAATGAVGFLAGIPGCVRSRHGDSKEVQRRTGRNETTAMELSARHVRYFMRLALCYKLDNVTG